MEVDEIYIGGPEKALSGRAAGDKALVVIAAEERGRGIGRIRMRRIPDASSHSLHGFVEHSMEAGSVVHTDGWQRYQSLERKGYGHEVTVLIRQEEGVLTRLVFMSSSP